MSERGITRHTSARAPAPKAWRASLLVLAAVLAVLATCSLGSPQRAQAIDWKYDCDSIVWNGSPVDVNVRLLPPTWVPFPGVPMYPVSGTPPVILTAWVTYGAAQ